MDELTYITSQINDKIAHLSDHIINGRIKTFDEYTKICGEIQGLSTAKSFITALQNKMENSDE